RLNEEKNKLTNKSAKLKIFIQNLQYMIEETNSIISELNNYKSMLERNVIDNNLNIKINDIIDVKINIDILDKEHKNDDKEQNDIAKRIDINEEDSITNKIKKIDSNIEELSNKLDEPNKKYKKYELELKDWSEKIASINGDI